MQKLDYENFIDILNEMIPEFQGFDHLKEHKMIYFNAFADFVEENFNNVFLTEKVALFINIMSESDDDSLLGILDEFFLNIYSSGKARKSSNDNLLRLFSAKATKMFHESVDIWLKGNS